ncbi:hypothetical protein, partial [Sphingomonas beigongshangi]|uniref:hypothetical protein n=1 Tax=Sphingomonas beigongshangi TaxID=2782540 RepID=UPI001EEF4334
TGRSSTLSSRSLNQIAPPTSMGPDPRRAAKTVLRVMPSLLPQHKVNAVIIVIKAYHSVLIKVKRDFGKTMQVVSCFDVAYEAIHLDLQLFHAFSCRFN